MVWLSAEGEEKKRAPVQVPGFWLSIPSCFSSAAMSGLACMFDIRLVLRRAKFGKKDVGWGDENEDPIPGLFSRFILYIAAKIFLYEKPL